MINNKDKYYDERKKFRKLCKCGWWVTILNKKGKKICPNCGEYVYLKEIDEFKDKLNVRLNNKIQGYWLINRMEKKMKLTNKIKKYIKNLKKNTNWELRYKNLSVKYLEDTTELKNKIKSMEIRYKKDNVIRELESTKKELEHRTLQRDCLRKDIQKLYERIEKNGRKTSI